MNANKSDNLGDAKPETPTQAEKPVTAPRFRARAQRVPGETTGSLCRISAQHLGLLGTEVAPGRYQLRCPWAHQHAPHCKQRDGILDNSTILYMPGAELSDAERAAQGDDVPLDGGLFCMHEHSAGSQKGVPLNAEVFLSYARACGAPLPDRPRYMVDGKDEGDDAPLLGADLPPQERCDIDPDEPMRAFSFDDEGAINTGELSAEEVCEMRCSPPGASQFHPASTDSAKVDKAPPLVMEDGIPTFDSLVNRVSAMLSIPKDVVLASAATLAKSQGFRIPAPPASPAPAAPDWFSAFLSECCIVDADASVPTPDLRGVFEIWYKANHEGSPPLAQFWKMLAEKGYESDRGSTGSFRLRRGLKLAKQSRAYQEFLKSESASGSADTVAPVQPLAVLHVAASAEIVMLNGLTLPLIQIRTNGDEVEITYQATHKDVPGGACYADVVACLQINPVPVKHHALNAVGITMLRVTKLDLPKQVSKGVAHATLTGINASTKIAATFAEYVGERPTTPFKKFLADCLTPIASWQMQLIFGRLHSAEPHTAERCYVHVGRGVNGKTTLLNAVARVFQAARLTSDLKTDAKLLLREPRMAILECADEASDVWLKTMSTSGSQVHITSNHDIKALDKGALRRVKIFAWEKTISEPDPDMEDKIANDPDFLIWLAEGLRRYQAGEREIP